MNTQYTEHIGIYKNVFPVGFCQHLIEEFERLEKDGAGSNRQKSESADRHSKDDYQIVLNLKHQNLGEFENRRPIDLFFEGLQNCYDAYSEKYSVLKNSGGVRATHVKMQRTAPGGGYHVWHCEQGGGPHANRVLTYMIYLNSMEPSEGAETEFLYQRLRINPEENTMLLWPAAYTHAHRGNAVLGQNCKYIVTGWFYLD